MTRSPWARAYARTPRLYIWGTTASDFARRVRPLVDPPARVLELGAGEGRDAVYFARHGLAVTALEVSAAGLRKARRLAAARGVRVRWVQGDMARVPVAGRFGLVYSCGSLHYVPRAARGRLLARFGALTAPGGYHAHVVFTDRRVYVEQGEVVDYFRTGELAALYAGWRIVHHAARTIWCAEDGTAHRHGVDELIAAKRG
jgi:tellurite methyltransferase